VRGVDLHAVKACVVGDLGGAGEAGDDRFDLHIGQGARRAEEPVATDGEGHLGRADDVLSTPAQPVAAHGVPPWVRQLQDELDIGALGHLGPPAQLLPVSGVLDHHVARCFQRRAIDHHVAADQQPGAGERQRPVGGDELVGRCAATIGQMLAGRGLRDPIRQGDAAAQGKRLGQRPSAQNNAVSQLKIHRGLLLKLSSTPAGDSSNQATRLGDLADRGSTRRSMPLPSLAQRYMAKTELSNSL
jgi:hypothetical protein